MLGLEQEVPAPAILDPLDWTGRGTHHGDVLARTGGNQPAKPFSGLDRELRGRIFLEPAEHDVRKPDVRWIRWIDTSRHLLAHERLVVVRYGVADRVVGWNAGLDQHAPSLHSPARASGDLTQQLKAALRRPEIRKVDPDIGVYHPNERDIRKVEAFRDHLRSEQNVDLAAGDAIENPGVRPFPARGVEVHSRDSRRGKSLAQKPLDLLRSKSTLLEIASAAPWAIRSWIFLVQAVMADQSLRIPVMGERDAAMRARCDRSTVDALDERRVATAVQEKNALLTAAQTVHDRVV